MRAGLKRISTGNSESVLAQRHEVEALARRHRPLGVEEAGPLGLERGAQALRNEDLDALPDELLVRVAEEGLGLVVDEGNPSVAADDHHPVGGGLEERPEPLLGHLDSPLRLPAFFAYGPFAQLALDCREQAHHPLLGQEVVGAGAKHLDGVVLVEGPGEDDEGHVGASRPCDGQGGQRVERGHSAVRDDEIPRVVLHRRAHGAGRLDPLVGNLVATPAQLAHDEVRVGLRVLHHQQAQIAAHQVSGLWLSTSQ